MPNLLSPLLRPLSATIQIYRRPSPQERRPFPSSFSLQISGASHTSPLLHAIYHRRLRDLSVLLNHAPPPHLRQIYSAPTSPLRLLHTRSSSPKRQTSQCSSHLSTRPRSAPGDLHAPPSSGRASSLTSCLLPSTDLPFAPPLRNFDTRSPSCHRPLSLSRTPLPSPLGATHATWPRLISSREPLLFPLTSAQVYPSPSSPRVHQAQAPFATLSDSSTLHQATLQRRHSLSSADHLPPCSSTCVFPPSQPSTRLFSFIVFKSSSNQFPPLIYLLRAKLLVRLLSSPSA